MSWPVELALGLLAVDFVSGLVHWAEDTFGTESTPVLGAWLVAPNVLHHAEPLAFTARSWLASSWDCALAALGIAVAAALCGELGPGVLLFALVGANANELHKWCHAPARAPRFVRALWSCGLLQRPWQHAQHHGGAKNRAYCVVTPWLNPLLDACRFWRGLERLTVPIVGAPRRADLAGLRAPGWRRTRRAPAARRRACR